jgi:hypothetical protein
MSYLWAEGGGMSPSIRITASEDQTRDNIDSARRSRAFLLSKALWDAGARPGDIITNESWALAETAAAITPTSNTTRLYALELLRCKAEGREPLLIAGRHYDLEEKDKAGAMWADNLIRNFAADKPHLDAEQIAVMTLIVFYRLAKSPVSAPQSKGCAEDVLSALINMRVKASVAQAAVRRAASEVGTENFDVLFPLAIRYVNPVEVRPR